MVGNSSVVGVQRECEMSRQASSEGEPQVALELQARSANCSTELSTRLAPEPLAISLKDAPGLLLNKQVSDHSNHLPCTANGIQASDCYSWRKYGKKQMKSSNVSRSYYRCADSKCRAKKKVQQNDHSGHVVDVTYIGCHNHEPLPMKCNRSKGQSSQQLPESERRSSSNSNGNVGIKAEDQNADRVVSNEFLCSSPIGTQENSPHTIAATKVLEQHIDAIRLEKPEKERGGLHPDCVLRAINEPNIVIYAASDVGSSCDGYRWRKYGQKMVKGNSQFRSYYRCTSSGCPARKHVERSTDNAVSTVVTYGGKHDHDVPELVIRKRHEPKSSLVHKKPKTLSCQKPSTAEEEVDLMGEKILELGGEKALESAQTLLSIGSQL